MMWLGLCILISVVWFDARLLRSKSPTTFQEIFELTGGQKLLLIIAILGISLMGSAAKDLFPALLAVVLLPMYWFRREAFLANVEEWNPLAESTLAEDPWSLKVEAFGVILGWFISGVAAAISVRLIMGSDESKSELLAIIVTMLISSAVVLHLIAKGLSRRTSLPFKSAVGLTKDQLTWWQVYLMPTLLAVGCGFIAALVASDRIQPSTPLSKIVDANTSSIAMVSFLAVAVVLAPLVEEIIFRGYFFPLLEKLKGRNVALVVIALIFALLHVEQYWGDVQAIGMVTVLGLLLTLIRARTGSTLPGVVMHYVYNFSVTVIPIVLLFNSNPSYYKYKAYGPTFSEVEKIELLKSSLDVDPDLAEAANDLAWIYSNRGEKLDEALNLINKALKLSPEVDSYLDTKAEVLEKLGRFSESKEIREKLLKNEFMVTHQREKLKSYQPLEKKDKVLSKKETKTIIKP